MAFSMFCVLAKGDTSLDECLVSKPTYPKKDFLQLGKERDNYELHEFGLHSFLTAVSNC